MKSKYICIIAFLLLTIATEVYLGTYYYASVPNQQLYGSFSPTGGGTYTLQSSISSTQNTITLTSFTEPVSNIPYTMSYIGSDIIYGTISPSSGRSEFISATGITQNANGTATLTGVTRGESKTPGTGGCVASSTLATGWPGQTQFILSNTPCFYSEYAARRDAQDITGVWSFASTSAPKYDAAYNASGNEFVSFNQLNSVAIQGAGTSTEGVLGLVALDQASNLANGTASTTSGAPLVIQNKFATTTPGTLCTGGTWNCIVAAVSGKISQSWLDLTAAFTVSGNWIFNGTATFNSTVALPTTTTLNGVTLAHEFGGTGTDGALSISSGTTTIDLGSSAYLEKNYTSISITGTGALTFSNAAAGGTFIVLRSQGNVTLTCGGDCIDVHGLGGSGGAASPQCSSNNQTGGTGTAGNSFYLFKTNAGTGGVNQASAGAGGALPTAIAPASRAATSTLMKYGGQFWVGSGGGGGGCSGSGTTAQGGAGGAGGGGILLEVGGALNLTASPAIYAAGANGSNGTLNNCGAGGGGGGGGNIAVFYNTLTALTGTVSAPGGTGGNSSAASCGAAAYGGGGGSTAFSTGNNGTAPSTNTQSGGNGATGVTSIVQNTNFF